jgi:hypothetical protein
MQYAIIDGSIPALSFVLNIKKDNVDRNKLKSLESTNEIIDKNGGVVLYNDKKSNYFYFSLIGTNFNMIKYIFKQGYEPFMAFKYNIIERLSEESKKEVTIRGILNKKKYCFF